MATILQILLLFPWSGESSFLSSTSACQIANVESIIFLSIKVFLISFWFCQSTAPKQFTRDSVMMVQFVRMLVPLYTYIFLYCFAYRDKSVLHNIPNFAQAMQYCNPTSSPKHSWRITWHSTHNETISSDIEQAHSKTPNNTRFSQHCGYSRHDLNLAILQERTTFWQTTWPRIP